MLIDPARASVVFSIYNRAPQALAGIASLARQPVHPFEFILIDDGSSDDVLSVFRSLERDHPSIFWRYIRLNDHPGPRISCYPRNVGIRQAAGDFVVLCEPEILHCANSFAALAGANPDPKSYPVATQIWSMGERFYRALAPDDLWDPDRLLKHPYAMLTSGNMVNSNAPDSDWALTGELNCWAGCFFALPRELLLEVRGFDEDFTGHGFDDFDLYYRLEILGYAKHAMRQVGIIHLWHPKNYPYNIYAHAEANGQRSVERFKAGEHRANLGRDWGVLPP